MPLFRWHRETCILFHTYFLGTNNNSSIIFFISSGDMYLFLGVAIHTSSSFVLSLLCNSFTDFFETLVILSAILLPTKSLVDSAVFWIALFEAVFIASVVDFLALSISFWPYLLLKLLKNPYPFTYILSLSSIEYLIFIWNLYLTTIVKFILSSISNE